MPELPEVETIVRALRNGGRGGLPLPGRAFERAEILWPRTLAEPGFAELQTQLPGQVIAAIDRRGKFIVLCLARHALLVHLRMSGDLRVEPACDAQGAPAPLQPHDRAVFYLSGAVRLVFNDARKFGRIWLLEDPQALLGKLGPEPLDPALTPTDFFQSLQLRRRQVKPLLLDQAFIAGLGNIYTDEALHLARLHPLRRSDALDPDEAGRLLEAIRVVLAGGIRAGGASIDWAYRGGGFQNDFRVYGRAGQPCPLCGAPIVRIIVGQRSAHFCPLCQPSP